MNNDIVTKARLNAALGTEGNMGFEHNDIVTVDKMNGAIAEGGGGGADGVKTAKVTLTVNAGTGGGALSGGVEGTLEGCVFLSEHGVVPRAGAAAGNTVELTAILTEVEEGMYAARYFVNGSNPVVTGDCELSELDPDIVVTVTGDCTITLDPVGDR